MRNTVARDPQTASGSLIDTIELCQRAGVTRNVLLRLRRQYPERLPAPARVFGMALAWDPAAIDSIRALLAEEAR